MEEDMEIYQPSEEIRKRDVYEGFDRKIFSNTPACPGCGAALALKMVLQVVENPVLVNSTGCMTLLAENIPMIHAGNNAVASASAISRVLKKQGKEKTVICFSGDAATYENLSSLMNSAKSGDDVIYICYNNFGHCNIDEIVEKKINKIIRTHASYTATASVSHYEDFVNKIKAALDIKGFRFIEVLTPCPPLWGFENSDTILAGSMAVETGFWVLYKTERRKVSITSMPSRLEPIERFSEMYKGLSGKNNEYLEKLHEKVKKEYKYLKKLSDIIR